MEFQVGKLLDSCSRVRFCHELLLFCSLAGWLTGVTGPSQVFLLTAAPLGRARTSPPGETKPKWYGAGDHDVQPERIVSSITPSHVHTFISTHHYGKVLAQEARKVVITLI